MHVLKRTLWTATLGMVTAATPLMAQQRFDQTLPREDDQNQNQRDRADQRDQRQDQRTQQQNQRDQQRTQQQQQRQQRQQQQRDPQAQRQQKGQQILIIGYDLNRDGRSDLYYFVTPADYNRLSRAHDQQRRQNVTLQGEVTETRQVNIKGQQDKHRLIKMKTDRGQEVMVNLGPKARLSDMDLRRGDQIRVQGRVGTINGKNVLMAKSVRSGNQTHNIARQGQLFDSPRDRSASIQGEIEQVKQFNMKGQQDAHNLARIRMQDGQSVVVNLGPKRNLRDLQLSEGDRVTIQGRRGKIDGKTVVLAEQIRSNNQTARVNWDRQGQDSVLGTPRDQQRYGNQQQRDQQRYRDQQRDPEYDRFNTPRNQRDQQQRDQFDTQRNQRDRQQTQRDRQTSRQMQQQLEQALRQAGADRQEAQRQAQQLAQQVQQTRNQQQAERQIEQALRQAGADRQEAQRQAQQLARQAQQGQDDNVFGTPRDQQSPRDQQRARDYTFRGELEAFVKTRIPGSNRETTLVKMWLQDGDSMVIDLGSETSLSELGLVGLADDERVVVRGRKAMRDNREVLVAESITIDGDRTQLRSASQQQQRDQQQSQRNQRN